MRILLAIGFALMVAGCALPAHNLSVESVRELRLERVEVVLEPAVRINWIGAKDELAKSRKPAGDGADAPISVEALQGYIISQLNQHARAALEPNLRSVLSGTKPVIIRLTVKSLDVPGFGEGLARTIVLGAGSYQSDILVRVDVIDTRTGTPILTLERIDAATQGSYALMGTDQPGLYSNHPVDRLFARLAERISSWLLKT
jgi:hypothetical protein